MRDTKIISAFPSCGKTYFYEKSDSNIIVLDCDSSKFSWIARKGEKQRNPDFPNNYINHIIDNIGKVDYILVSSHDVVREALNNASIDFAIVFPEQSLKAEWIGRCFLRGSGEAFCKLISENWDDWIREMELESIEHSNCYRLRHGEYLSDAMKFIG